MLSVHENDLQSQTIEWKAVESEFSVSVIPIGESKTEEKIWHSQMLWQNFLLTVKRINNFRWLWRGLTKRGGGSKICQWRYDSYWWYKKVTVDKREEMQTSYNAEDVKSKEVAAEKVLQLKGWILTKKWIKRKISVKPQFLLMIQKRKERFT